MNGPLGPVAADRADRWHLSRWQHCSHDCDRADGSTQTSAASSADFPADSSTDGSSTAGDATGGSAGGGSHGGGGGGDDSGEGGNAKVSLNLGTSLGLLGDESFTNQSQLVEQSAVSDSQRRLR